MAVLIRIVELFTYSSVINGDDGGRVAKARKQELVRYKSAPVFVFVSFLRLLCCLLFVVCVVEP